MSKGIEAYPLCWPEGWSRSSHQIQSKFKTTFAIARDCLFDEIRRMGGANPVLSTNVELRLDGIPYASRKAPEDCGVAVYFEYKKKPLVFASDKWNTVADNIQAIRKTIEALRGIERWGASDMMERAFTGFAALPDFSSRTWYQVLGVFESASLGEVKSAYSRLRMKHHPDKPTGDKEEFIAVQEAWKEYKAKESYE